MRHPLYGCMDHTNSLLVVPPGSTRASLGYCERCRAERCVFLPCGSYELVSAPARPKRGRIVTAAGQARRRAKALEKRAQGQGPNGRPLGRTCWNCAQLCRLDGQGYVCPQREEPRGKKAVKDAKYTAQRCDGFEMRLGEVKAA